MQLSPSPRPKSIEAHSRLPAPPPAHRPKSNEATKETPEQFCRLPPVERPSVALSENDTDLGAFCKTPCTLTQKVILIVNVIIIVAALAISAYGYYYYTRDSWKIDYRVLTNGTEKSKTAILLAEKLHCIDKALAMNIQHYGQYWILENYVVAKAYEQASCGGHATYVTHIRDLRMFKNLPELAARWNGPVSVGLFAPMTDLKLILLSMQYVRNCLPKSQIVVDAVSFHIVLPHNHMPMSILQDRSFHTYVADCNQTAPYLKVPYGKMYASEQQLPYPINILRNAARRAINTYYYLTAEAYYLPKQDSSFHFISFIFAKYCKVLKRDNSEHSATMSVCKALHSQEDIMRQMHLLPSQLHNIETIYPATLMEVKTNIPIPESNTAFKLALRRGDVSKTFYLEYAFFGGPDVPYYDERIYWQKDLPNQLQTYMLCLLDYNWEPVPSVILWTYSNQTSHPNYPSTDQFTAAAQYLNKTMLKLEYDNLYGDARSLDCYKCYRTDAPCVDAQ